MARLWCWLTGHRWTYVCSFTYSKHFPFGGFRGRCERCKSSILVGYSEKMEYKENGDG